MPPNARDSIFNSISAPFLIKNVSEAGIPSVKYNLNIIGIPRSEKEKGRGGSFNSTLRFNKIKNMSDPGIAGLVDEDTFWERIDYFLENFIFLRWIFSEIEQI